MAGRSLAWFPIAMSVAATTISANGFLGGPGWAYTDGLSPYMIQAAIPLAIFFVVYTTLPVCYSLKLTSIYEYIELRLGPRTRLLTVLGFFANAIIQIGSMVFIPSLVISFFTGWSMLAVVPLVVLTAIAYTLLGGMKAAEFDPDPARMIRQHVQGIVLDLSAGDYLHLFGFPAFFFQIALGYAALQAAGVSLSGSDFDGFARLSPLSDQI